MIELALERLAFYTLLNLGLGAIALAAGAFATAVRDTLGSELGQLFGRRPILPNSFRRVEAGSEGAISLEGSAAGFVGSLALAALAAWGSLYPWRLVWIPVLAALVGTTVESLLGAMGERGPKLGNESSDLLSGLAGALVAVALGRPAPGNP